MTSRYNCSMVEYYQSIYQGVGSRGSALTVVPFNQDVEALADYIYATLGMVGKSTALMISPSLCIASCWLISFAFLALSRQAVTSLHVLQVILPLSPNHGLFGNDGLYSELKISLETLFNRWSSKSWGEYLCLAGVVIGWTRGTGLMDASNVISRATGFAHSQQRRWCEVCACWN